LKFVDRVAQRLRTMPPGGAKNELFKNRQFWAPLRHAPNIPAPPNFQIY